MFLTHIGEISALAVAISWTITAMAFEHASNRVGSLNVNLLRLPLGFIYLSIFTFFSRSYALPVDANSHQWIWLSISGLIGFSLGDLLLLKAFTFIGSHLSMLIYTIVPPLTAIIGWFALNESLNLMCFIGMMLTLIGIVIAINSHRSKETNKFSKVKIKGIVLAIGGAIGQSVGLILSKIGMQSYNAFAASQIRIIAGIVGFLLIMVLLNRMNGLSNAFKDSKGMRSILIGSFFGPFVGVSLSLFSVQHSNTGVASTIMSIVPILLIPTSIIFFKRKITSLEIVGTIISIIGVALFFI
jgi:drug/metabolite transporter (DMT)-like permease